MEVITIVATAISFMATIGICAFYLNKVKKAMAEAKELFVVIVDAMTDNEISAEEIKKIVAEAKDVGDAVKSIFTKYKKEETKE